MKVLSLNARTHVDAEHSEDVEIVLFEISHPDLDAPVRISTDPTERISADPLAYGTRSEWNGADTVAEPFLFVIVNAELPGEEDNTPAQTRLIIYNTDSRLAEALEAITTPAQLNMAVVMASSPDVPEIEYFGLDCTSVEADEGEISISFSRHAIEDELAPYERFTRERFPGLIS
ncbi:hypothetical protein [uncultured Tateyamaria sp.]|uniref:hypothetical protein n=1 Tax=uncultured Tateyamaria sp. TaxID=455651 RepID=UPI002632F492|nr:hypothetical protein [uncultured Tateyamaria sp.]